MRITLQELMTHDWVTKFGEDPLPSLKSMLKPPEVIEVSRHIFAYLTSLYAPWHPWRTAVSLARWAK